jgi:streptogramin lyase
LAVLALALPGAADAKPRLAGTFDVSDKPGQITRGSGGTMWALIDGNKLARIRPNGNVTEFSPPELNGPKGLTMGRDGNLWATQNQEVVRIPPGDPENGAEDFTVAAIGSPQRIVNGPRGKLWTASDDQLVSFDPADPDGFDARTIDGMNARGIAAADGKIWIVDFAGKRIIRTKPSGGLKSFNVGGGPQEVATGPKKRAAYTNQGTDPHTVGRIIPKRKPIKNKVPDTDPFGITFAAGSWWIANFNSDNLTMLPVKGKPRRRLNSLPDNCGPRWLAAGAKGTLWVSLENSSQIARIKGVKR